PAIARRRGLERADRRVLEAVARERMQREHVDLDAAPVERDAIPIRDDPLARLVVHEAAQLRKAPAERSSRIVRDLPQQVAQMLALERPAVQRQIGKERPRFLGRGQLDARAVAQYLEPPEEPELERGHERIVVLDLHAAKRSQPRDEAWPADRPGTENHRAKSEKPRSLPRLLPRSRASLTLERKAFEEKHMARYDNILETIGNTPLVRLGKLAPAGVNVYVKIESFNPMGSVKDRMALAVIERAERTGELMPGQTVVEATSGNTGIGLAMVCAQKGYPLVVTMAESFSIERRKLLRFLGAKVVLTPAAEKGTGMLAKAVELAETHGWFLCRQFENEANANVHSSTTAQEIIADFTGERLDYWVSGFGTGGTLKGVARALKQAGLPTKIVAAGPDNAQVLGSGIRQRRAPDGTPAE